MPAELPPLESQLAAARLCRRFILDCRKLLDLKGLPFYEPFLLVEEGGYYLIAGNCRSPLGLQTGF